MAYLEKIGVDVAEENQPVGEATLLLVGLLYDRYRDTFKTRHVSVEGVSTETVFSPDLIDAAKTRTGPDGRRPAIADEEIARRLAMARAEVAALGAMSYLGVSRNAKTATPGAEGSIVKLHYSELHKEVARLAVDILGADGITLVSRWLAGGWTGEYLSSFSLSIGGGTSEIQRNIIGDRVLGLPR